MQLLALSDVRWPGHGVVQIGSFVIAFPGSAVDGPSPAVGVWQWSQVSKQLLPGDLLILCYIDHVSERIIHLCLTSHSSFLSFIVM